MVRRDVCYPYFYLFLLRGDGRLARTVIISSIQTEGVEISKITQDAELTGIHSHTPHRGSDIQPPASASFTKLSMLPRWITHDTNCSWRPPTHTTHLPALQLQNHRLGLFVLRHDTSIRSRTPAKHRRSIRLTPNSMHNASNRDHMQRETIPLPARLSR